MSRGRASWSPRPTDEGKVKLETRLRILFTQMAGGRGFEPRLMDPESIVLPLDDPPVTPQNRTGIGQKIQSPLSYR